MRLGELIQKAQACILVKNDVIDDLISFLLKVLMNENCKLLCELFIRDDHLHDVVGEERIIECELLEKFDEWLER